MLWRLYGTPDLSSALPADVDVLTLLSRTVERMDAEVLRHTLSLGAGGLVLERCWQMEFYRVCASLLLKGAAVSPDVGQVGYSSRLRPWGSCPEERLDSLIAMLMLLCSAMQALGGNGYMDFFISDPYCMGLELTREGSSINEHLGRFLNPCWRTAASRNMLW